MNISINTSLVLAYINIKQIVNLFKLTIHLILIYYLIFIFLIYYYCFCI